MKILRSQPQRIWINHSGVQTGAFQNPSRYSSRQPGLITTALHRVLASQVLLPQDISAFGSVTSSKSCKNTEQGHGRLRLDSQLSTWWVVDLGWVTVLPGTQRLPSFNERVDCHLCLKSTNLWNAYSYSTWSNRTLHIQLWEEIFDLLPSQPVHMHFISTLDWCSTSLK